MLDFGCNVSFKHGDITLAGYTACCLQSLHLIHYFEHEYRVDQHYTKSAAARSAANLLTLYREQSIFEILKTAASPLKAPTNPLSGGCEGDCNSDGYRHARSIVDEAGSQPSFAVSYSRVASFHRFDTVEGVSEGARPMPTRARALFLRPGLICVAPEDLPDRPVERRGAPKPPSGPP